MNASVAPRVDMTIEQYLVWAEAQPGAHYELVDGAPCRMSPERASHAWVKGAICRALEDAVREAGLAFLVFPEGPTVVTGERRAREPDVVVHPAQGVEWDAMILGHPIILVEVTSPSTVETDTGIKVSEYFSITSVSHYLVVDPIGREVVHHQRGKAGAPVTRSATDGTLVLDPPGLTLSAQRFFAGLPPRGSV